MKKHIVVCFVLLFPIWCSAQKGSDSLFRNYLYDTRCLYFSQLPVVPNAIIFFGDSMTHWGDWAELVHNDKALNRGIAGDNTYGLLNRLGDILRYRPSKLFVLIGTNDLNVHIPQKNIVENYQHILQEIKIKSPHTAIVVQSIFPINNELIGRQYYTATNNQIRDLNRSIDSLCAQMGVRFVDLYQYFLDDKNQLPALYTIDGLHLNGNGYLRWIHYLKKQNLL